MVRKLFQNGAGYFQTALNWLIGVGRSPNGNFLSRFYATQFLSQQFSSVLLDVDLSLEIHAVAEFHELVGITRVAILTGELASPVRIDGPGKGHSANRATVEQRAHRQSEIFHVVPLPEGLALGGQTSNPNQSGTRWVR